ncbi:MAG TPA: phosphoadenosine phosphosulfate reductase family protein [Phycisphaerae bacterium]|nr:phosphoadenosine phosphosulfate reductase family protein [Phycisphaerae bacterium]HRY67878.1 phosphoadenosine phosphosulfate reductase family protein [Phycisphaerae bacterium]HSA25332.1 phosphoadenosine phosphosulfate reductase family protein [Phycisphaerae bacterium]
MTTPLIRHIVSLSGGKDSTALAIYLRDRIRGLEYVFSDTDKELSETYEYLDKLEAYLGKEIVRLRDDRGFDFWLRQYGGYLPSSRMRWCTKMLKIKPFEKYIGDDSVKMYVGIRADEDREGYRPTKPNITPVYPFVEAGFDLEAIHRILAESGIQFPKYYSWRTRSGCYFCFYQRKHEWLGLRENHPDLFEKAKSYEKIDPETGQRYTWSERESLDELEHPGRVAEIKEKRTIELRKAQKQNAGQPLLHVLGDIDDADGTSMPCSFCHI